jgi:hypothetical protein
MLHQIVVFFKLVWRKGSRELLPSLFICCQSLMSPSLLTFHIFIISSETTEPIGTKLCRAGVSEAHWNIPFCLDLPKKNMATLWAILNSDYLKLLKSSPLKVSCQLVSNFVGKMFFHNPCGKTKMPSSPIFNNWPQFLGRWNSSENTRPSPNNLHK